MWPDIVRDLRCPVCAGDLHEAGSALRCERGHSFDRARQGYVNLLTGRAPAGADTAGMVAARAAFLGAGHFDGLTAAVVEAASRAAGHWPRPAGLIVDVGAGTGAHLAAVLDALPDHHGLALDIAKAAARHAARAHPRAAAAVCDAWHALPLADGCADLVLNVFAPRNGGEFHRVLRPTGTLLVVTPRADHLAELVDALGLIGVDPDKERRLGAALGDRFELEGTTGYADRLVLNRNDAANLVAMGPSAFHPIGPLADLPDPLTVTVSVDLWLFHPPPGRRSRE